MGACAADGQLDTAKYSEPMLWVGLYIAMGSLVCTLCIAADGIRSLVIGVTRFGAKYFPLNAITLTFLSIATKFAVDLNTAMPGRADQLSKLSAVVFLCVAMSHYMNSLESMSNANIASNVAALGVLVVTVIVNICIQLATGVIYMFLPEHAIMVVITLFILLLLLSTAASTPVMRDILDNSLSYYRSELSSENYTLDEFLYDHLHWVWIKSRQLTAIIHNRITCSAMLCLVTLGILTEATVRSFVGGSVEFCKGRSDYQWSTTLVLIIQAITICLGTIALSYMCTRVQTGHYIHRGRGLRYGYGFSDDEYVYWFNKLHVPMEDYSFSNIHVLKNILFYCLFYMHLVVVWLSRLFEGPLEKFLSMMRASVEIPSRLKYRFEKFHSVRPPYPLLPPQKVLVDSWITEAKKMKPGKLMELTMQKHSGSMSGFHGVLASIDNLQCPRLNIEIRGWSLPIVTLANIAIRLTTIENQRTAFLIEAVRQGLRYARFIDNIEGTPGSELAAADNLWYEINFKTGKRNSESASLVLHRLKTDSDASLSAGKQSEMLQSHCASQIVSTIMNDYGRTGQRCDSYPFLPRTDDNVFDWIEKTTSDIMRACLTNLPAAIQKSCTYGSIEKMEDSVKFAALVLGQVHDDILRPLYYETDSEFVPKENRESISAWHQHLRTKVQPQGGVKEEEVQPQGGAKEEDDKDINIMEEGEEEVIGKADEDMKEDGDEENQYNKSSR